MTEERWLLHNFDYGEETPVKVITRPWQEMIDVKKNHEEVELFIRRAIQSCSYDDRLAEVKEYLAAALQSVSKVSEKRQRHTASQKMFEEGTKKQNQWWDKLKKNAAKFKFKPPEDK